jgi:hypothetical protein
VGAARALCACAGICCCTQRRTVPANQRQLNLSVLSRRALSGLSVDGSLPYHDDILDSDEGTKEVHEKTGPSSKFTHSF